MAVDKTLLDDLMKVGENALGTLFGARHEAASQARAVQERMIKKLDLVSRKEFAAAFAMLAKYRDQQEDIMERLQRIETKLNLSRPERSVKKQKVNLRSVNQGNRKASAKKRK